MAPVGTLYYIENTVYKAEKALISAKFNGVEIATKAYDPQKDAKKPEMLAKNPTGKVPFLHTEHGCVFTSHAVAKFVARCRADTSLYGQSFDEESAIDSWLDFCTHEVEIPLMTWVYPVLGMLEDVPEATRDAQADVKKALGVLEKQLAGRDFVVSGCVTLADVALVCALKEGFVNVFEPSFRKPFPKVCQWFERCCQLPQFKAVLGAVNLCASAAKPKPVLPAFAPPARSEQKAKAAAPAAQKGGQKEAARPAEEAAPAKAAPAPVANGAGGAGGDAEAKIKAVGDEIRILKEKLKGEGLSGKKINDHEEVKRLVAQLQELKAGAPPVAAVAPAASVPAEPAEPAAAAAGGGDAEAQVQAVGDQIRTLKEKLKGEGLSGKKINDHEEVKKLVARLQELKAQLPK